MQGGAPRPHEDAGVARRREGNCSLLRRVVDEGQVDAEIQASFTLERLERSENFLSLLYYFGLLSIGEADAGWTRLHIPNKMARRLLCDLLRDVYGDVDALPDPAQAHQVGRSRLEEGAGHA